MEASAAPAARPVWKEEKRIVCVMFCDLSGYSAMSTRLPVEELPELLNLFLDVAGSVIRRHGGTVSKIIGDSVLALFGYPTAQEDDVVRAALAALGIQQEVRTLAKARGLDFSMTIGIHTGEVLTTILHAGEVQEITVVGEAVNVARQLQEMAAPDEILVSEDLLPALTNYCQLKPRGTFVPKGRAENANLYHVAGWLESLATPALKTFIGRKAETRRFRELARRARKGDGAVYGIIGDVGVGKTTLLQKFRELADEEGLTPLVVRAFSHHSTTPYRAFCDHISQLLKIPAATAHLKSEEKRLLQRLAAYETDLSDLLPNLEPEKRKAYLFALFQQALFRAAEKRPLCILLDDYQWLDEPSRQALEVFLPRVHHRPILACFTTRPGRRPFPLSPGADFFTRKALENWNLDEVRQAVRTFHPACYHEEACVVKLYRQTQGNPLYLREVLHAMQAQGSAPGVDLESIRLPPTIGRAVLSKMDSLGEGARRIASAASVIGEQFSGLILQKVTGEVPGWRDALAELLRAGVLTEAQKHPWQVYEFAKPLYKKVLYEALLRKDRVDIHRRAARAMESVFRANPGRVLPRVAEHYLRGGDAETAARKFIEAGELALEQSAVRHAVEFFRSAKEALDPAQQTDPDWQLRWVRGTGISLRYAGRFNEALPALQSYAQLAVRFKARTRLVDALIHLGHVQAEIGDRDAAVASHTRAIEVARTLPDPKGKADALIALAVTFISIGKLAKARTLLNQCLAILHTHPNPRVESTALERLGHVSKELGMFEDAMEYFRRALTLARKYHDRQGEAVALQSVGAIHGKWGQYAKDLAVMDRARRIYDSIGDARGVAVCGDNIAFAYQVTGQPDKARTTYEQSLRLYEQMGSLRNQAFTYDNLGETCWALGQLGDAVRCHLKGKELAEKARYSHEGIINSGALASLYVELGAYPAAVRLLEPLMKKARRLGMKEYSLRCFLLKAQILSETGRAKAAEALFTKFLKRPEYREALGHASIKAEILRQRGLLCHARGARQEAERLLVAALKQAERARDQMSVGQVLISLAEANPAQWLPRATAFAEKSPYRLLEFRLSKLLFHRQPTRTHRRRLEKWVETLGRTLPEEGLKNSLRAACGLAP